MAHTKTPWRKADFSRMVTLGPVADNSEIKTWLGCIQSGTVRDPNILKDPFRISIIICLSVRTQMTVLILLWTKQFRGIAFLRVCTRVCARLCLYGSSDFFGLWGRTVHAYKGMNELFFFFFFHCFNIFQEKLIHLSYLCFSGRMISMSIRALLSCKFLHFSPFGLSCVSSLKLPLVLTCPLFGTASVWGESRFLVFFFFTSSQQISNVPSAIVFCYFFSKT